MSRVPGCNFSTSYLIKTKSFCCQTLLSDHVGQVLHFIGYLWKNWNSPCSDLIENHWNVVESCFFHCPFQSRLILSYFSELVFPSVFWRVASYRKLNTVRELILLIKINKPLTQLQQAASSIHSLETEIGQNKIESKIKAIISIIFGLAYLNACSEGMYKTNCNDNALTCWVRVCGMSFKLIQLSFNDPRNATTVSWTEQFLRKGNENLPEPLTWLNDWYFHCSINRRVVITWLNV